MLKGAAARVVFVASLGAAVGCASEDAQFEVRMAPDFERQGTSLSILGVFKNGQLSAEAWDELGPKLSRAFGANTCEIAYEPRFLISNPRLANAIDGYTKANGITDDLLEQLGPVAKGDAILTFTVVGEVASSQDAGPSAPALSPPHPRGRGGRGRRAMSPAPEGHRTESERNKFEMEAWVYSISMRRPVASVSMTYTGRNADEAIDKFGRELERDLKGASCSGWDWSTKAD